MRIPSSFEIEPEDQDAREKWIVKKTIARHGLIECPECKSWIHADTHEQRVFHVRRCERRRGIVGMK